MVFLFLPFAFFACLLHSHFANSVLSKMKRSKFQSTGMLSDKSYLD